MALTPDQQRRLDVAMAAALKAVHDGLVKLDRDAQAMLDRLMNDSADDIAKAIRRAAGPDGLVTPEAMPLLLVQIQNVIARLRDSQDAVVQQLVQQGAANGSQVISLLRNAADAGNVAAEAIEGLPDPLSNANEIAQAVIHSVAEDGLTLSDRIWRNWQALQAELVPSLQQAIVSGWSARDATREALRRGGVADDALLNQIEMARAGALGERAAQILATPEAQAYGFAARVMRTELDRANILAARASVLSVEGVVGTRFHLSPRHPRFDICDMHAAVNLYGLGAGGYPPGTSPLPAHPNTLSSETAIFEWDVTPQDKAGRHDLLSWLHKQSDDNLYGILQSDQKVAALRAGLLQADEITLPWRDLEPKHGASLGAPA